MKKRIIIERSIIAIFFGLWIVFMFWLYWVMKKNIISLVVVGLVTALLFWLRMRQIYQIEAVIRNRKIKKRTIGEIIENTAVLIFALWGFSMFWLWIFGFLASEVSLRNMLLAIGLIALVILGKLYRKYKDGAILVIMIIFALFLIERFFGVCV